SRITTGEDRGCRASERIGANADALERADSRAVEAEPRHRAHGVEHLAIELELERTRERGPECALAPSFPEHDPPAGRAADREHHRPREEGLAVLTSEAERRELDGDRT